MKRRAAYAALLLPLLALTGCGDDLQGTVTDKAHHPSYVTVIPIPLTTTTCTPVGKVTSCRTTITGYLPVPYTIPDCWEISVIGEKSGDTCLTQARWDDIAVGDNYVGEDVDAEDRKVRVND